jgi:hypothetical protein
VGHIVTICDDYDKRYITITITITTRCRSGAAITLLVDEVVVTVVATVNKSESI